MEKDRKIIQVAMAAHEGVGCIALCNDGTLWELYGLRGEWRQLPEIPQDINQEPPAEQKEVSQLSPLSDEEKEPAPE